MKRRGIPIEPGATFADALVLQMWVKAMAGDPKAAKEIRESIQGTAAQRPSDPGDKGPVTIRVVYDEEKKNLPPEPDLETGAVPSPDGSPKKYL